MATKKELSERGKSSRASGQRFEAKVRQNLEELGWTVAKWVNTIDYEKDKIVPAKRKYNPFLKTLSIGTGFPDFICFKKISKKAFDVIGLEVKGNGYLDQAEKGMCIWLLEKRIFSRILIAKKAKERGKKTNPLDDPNIEYIDFNVKYNK